MFPCTVTTETSLREMLNVTIGVRSSCDHNLSHVQLQWEALVVGVYSGKTVKTVTLARKLCRRCVLDVSHVQLQWEAQVEEDNVTVYSYDGNKDGSPEEGVESEINIFIDRISDINRKP